MSIIYQFSLAILFQLILLIPSYALVKKTKLFLENKGVELVLSYAVGILFFGILSIIGYIFRVPSVFLQVISWIVIISGFSVFLRYKLFKQLIVHWFPISCVTLMSIFSIAFVNLNYSSSYSYLPDPEMRLDRNYQTLNVKILNIAKTQANDNYVPYRQAQFINNRSDPGNDCFICEWGVHFFQRTPLMGSVAAGYFISIGDTLPVDYLWSNNSLDQDKTYIKFQILANILNSVFIIPAFFLLKKLFNKNVASISCLFLVPSAFFLYNTAFSWPKSLVAFFVLGMWLLLLYDSDRKKNVFFAGILGGLAYLSHDLAVFYIGASLLLLLSQRRYVSALILTAVSSAFAIPWLIISSVIYNKPSTFALYPFSLQGLPQPGKEKEILEEFRRTSPLEIISIRFDTLFYLLSPYDLIYKGGQSWARRIWATGIFSIPGSLGFGLVIPAVLGIFKKLKGFSFWILIVTPLLGATIIVGWRGSRAIASLHFAQAIIVLLTGLAIMYLLKIKSTFWLLLALAVNTVQTCFVILYSYDFNIREWFTGTSSLISLVTMISVIISCIVGIVIISRNNRFAHYIK